MKGTFNRYKAINYQETFTLITKMNIVRVLLSLASNLEWLLHQLDVKKTLLTWRIGRRNIYGFTIWI